MMNNMLHRQLNNKFARSVYVGRLEGVVGTHTRMHSAHIHTLARVNSPQPVCPNLV